MKRERPWTLVIALALFAALNIYLQQPFWRSAADYDPLSLARALALSASAAAAAATAVWLAPHTLLRTSMWCAAAVDRHAPLSRLALIACAGILPACIGAAALDGFPNSGDEYAYVFQAQQFAHGHLWAAPPPLDYALVAYRTWIIGDKWVSQYPPGWPAVLAPALALRLPGWLVTSALGALSTGVLFAIGRRLGNALPSVAFAVGAYALSLFYLLNAASFYSHMMTALLILLLCWSLASYQRQPRQLTLLVCGSLLGLIGITRYFSLLLLLPAWGWWFWTSHGGRPLRVLLLLALGATPFLGALLGYQYAVTGDALRSSYAVIADQDISLSLQPADVLHGLELTLHRVAELGLWSTPLLPLALAACLVVKWHRHRLAFYDLVFPGFLLGYVFFADLGGNRYGPRYYFDAYPLIFVTLLSTAPLIAGRRSRLPWAQASMAALLVSVTYMLIALPLACRAYHQEVQARTEVYRMSTGRGLRQAIVIVENSVTRGLRAVDLARNDPGLNAPILYARPGTSVSDLQRAFPQRAIWAYRHDRDSVRLWQLAPATR